jgi:long-chain acyl-CoA synthetase
MEKYSYKKPDNLVDLFESAIERFPHNNLFGITTPDRSSLNWMTYQDVGRRTANLRSGLSQLGVKKGDAVGIIANNRPEWAIAAFATYGLEGRYVPMYEAELVKTWRYIIADAGVKVLLISKPEIMEKLKGIKEEIPSLEHVYLIEGEGPGTMADLEEQGSKKPVPPTAPSAHDIAVLVYTSGTTGDPKGVLLTHGNVMHVARCGYEMYPDLNQNSRSLSILPWAHSYGQVAELYNWFQFGGSMGFMEKVETLADDLALVQPTFLLAVPRVFNRIYSGLWVKMREAGGIKLKLFEAAVASAKKKREMAERGESSFGNNLKLSILDKLVFSKIRQRLGGRLEGSLTASATMNPDVSRFFFDMGVPVYDCYGLSETSPAVTISCPTKFRVGTVGVPIEDVKVVVDKTVVEPGAEDGEVIVYGPNVMQGYHNKPKETKAVMTDDGGFRTGDRGRLDEDGFLVITGRIKEQFKLENGKYVFPADIEEDIKLLPAVDNIMIYGDGKPHVIGLVFPNVETLTKYARDNNISEDPNNLDASPTLRDYLTKEISTQLKDKYGGYEIPRKFVYLNEDFTVDNGMLTQTMKLKRRIVLEKYDKKIQGIYQPSSPTAGAGAPMSTSN